MDEGVAGFGYELDDFPIGSIVLTPLGNRAIVKRHLTGASKHDHFLRVILQYEGGHVNDMVTLQPRQLRPASKPTLDGQMSVNNAEGIDTYSYAMKHIFAALTELRMDATWAV
jgi:hypothetical protein